MRSDFHITDAQHGKMEESKSKKFDNKIQNLYKLIMDHTHFQSKLNCWSKCEKSASLYLHNYLPIRAYNFLSEKKICFQLTVANHFFFHF